MSNRQRKRGSPFQLLFCGHTFKGGSSADTLWFSFYENAAQYGAFTDATQASAEMAAAINKFFDYADCSSFLLNQEEIYNGGEQGSGPSAYIDAFACDFRDGAGPGSLPDLKSHIKGYLDSAGTHKSFTLYQQNSMTPTPETPDVRFFGVHNNASDWGTRQDSMAASEGGRQLLRHFNGILDCSINHWSGQQVVAGPDAG